MENVGLRDMTLIVFVSSIVYLLLSSRINLCSMLKRVGRRENACIQTRLFKNSTDGPFLALLLMRKKNLQHAPFSFQSFSLILLKKISNNSFDLMFFINICHFQIIKKEITSQFGLICYIELGYDGLFVFVSCSLRLCFVGHSRHRYLIFARVTRGKVIHYSLGVAILPKRRNAVASCS